jgi:hypothetical protein
VLEASHFPRHFFEDVRLHRFEGRSVVCKALSGEVRFEFLQQRVAVVLVGAIDRDALLGVRRGGGRGAKVGTGEAAQARQDFERELIEQIQVPLLRQGTALAVPFHDALFRGFTP